MDTTRPLLDRLLAEGRSLAVQAEGAAAQRLGLGDDPASRQRLRQTGLAGGAALGLVALLLGRRRGVSPGRSALLLGGIGILGKLALDSWSKPLPRDAATSFDESEARAQVLLFAMVAAAKADGHIDDEEHSAIEAELEDLPESVKGLLGEAIAAPADPLAIAARAHPGQEREIYAASALLCGRDHPEEVDYLDRLARALHLPDAEARRIEAEVLAAV